MHTKYIILDATSPVVFTAALNHDAVAACLGRSRVTSAGFVNVVPDPEDPDRIIAKPYGHSTSLAMKPAESDEYILTRLFQPYL